MDVIRIIPPPPGQLPVVTHAVYCQLLELLRQRLPHCPLTTRVVFIESDPTLIVCTTRVYDQHVSDYNYKPTACQQDMFYDIPELCAVGIEGGQLAVASGAGMPWFQLYWELPLADPGVLEQAYGVIQEAVQAYFRHTGVLDHYFPEWRNGGRAADVGDQADPPGGTAAAPGNL